MIHSVRTHIALARGLTEEQAKRMARRMTIQLVAVLIFSILLIGSALIERLWR